jgi:hypothetical protein
MSEKQWRVIADRDKGDDPQVSDLNNGDRATVIVMNDDPADDKVVRIERPVPTEHCLSTAHHDGHEWGAHESQPGTGYWCPGFDATEAHPPTREQIAEAVEAVAEAYAPVRDWDTELMYPDDTWDALVALHALIQNGADR